MKTEHYNTHLKKPRSKFPVQQDVEAEDLEAHAVAARSLSGATHAIRVEHVRLCHDQSLQDNLSDVPPHKRRVVIVLP